MGLGSMGIAAAGTITMESYNLVTAEPTGLISVESIDAPFRTADASRK